MHGVHGVHGLTGVTGVHGVHGVHGVNGVHGVHGVHGARVFCLQHARFGARFRFDTRRAMILTPHGLIFH